MTQTLTYGGITFPLSASNAGADLLETCDPFVFHTLPMFQRVINHYCGAAYSAAMSGQAQQVNPACVQVTSLDPVVWIGKLTWRPPLLALYPQQGAEQQLNLQRRKLSTRYELAYVLPQLTEQQAARVTPLLIAVRHLLSAVIERQGDPSYRSHDNPFSRAGVMSVNARDWRNTFLSVQSGAGTAEDFPCLLLTIDVESKLTFDQGETLDKILLYGDLTDPADTAHPLTSFVAADSSVDPPLAARPQNE